MLLVAMWQIYALTNAPVMLGLIGLVQGVPYILGSFWAGHIVDRHEKKGLILASIAALTGVTVALSLVSRLEHPPILALYALVAAGALLFTRVSRCRRPRLTSRSSSRPRPSRKPRPGISPTTLAPPSEVRVIGGLLLEHVSAAAVYAISAAGMLTGFVLAAPLKRIYPAPAEVHESAFKSVIAGLRFVVGKRIVFAAMVLDSFAVLFGEVVFILPVFAARAGRGPVGTRPPSRGARDRLLHDFCDAGDPSVHPDPLELACRARWPSSGRPSSASACRVGSSCRSRCFFSAEPLDGVSVIIRQSLYQRHTPDAYRGRASRRSAASSFRSPTKWADSNLASRPNCSASFPPRWPAASSRFCRWPPFA